MPTNTIRTQREIDLAEAREQLRLGGPLTEQQVAAFLQISLSEFRKLEAAGLISRIPGFGYGVKRFSTSEVQRYTAQPSGSLAVAS